MKPRCSTKEPRPTTEDKPGKPDKSSSGCDKSPSEPESGSLSNPKAKGKDLMAEVNDLKGIKTERRTVQLSVGEFEVLSLDDLDLASALKLGKYAQKLQNLQDLDDDEIDRTAAGLGAIVSKMLVAPDEVKASLGDGDAMRVVQAVFTQPAQADLTPAGSIN